MSLAATLAARRKTLGISQNDLSEMSGVSLATIKNIERGVGNPSFETVERILSVLGMEILFKVRNLYLSDLSMEFLNRFETQRIIFPGLIKLLFGSFKLILIS